MEQNELPDKARVIRFLLGTEGRIMLCLDAAWEGVEVPRRFLDDPALMLVLNREMPQPIHFLSDAVASELRFGGIPHYCIIPYAALWSVFNPDSIRGMLWLDSVPERVSDAHGVLHMPMELVTTEEVDLWHDEEGEAHPEVATADGDAQDQPGPASAQEKAPFLRVIEGRGETPPEEAATQSRRPHLRLVE